MSYKFRFFQKGAAGGFTGLLLMLVLLVFAEIVFFAGQEIGFIPEMNIFTGALVSGMFSFGAMIMYFVVARNLTKQGEARAYARINRQKDSEK